jgi:hypothetical protein
MIIEMRTYWTKPDPFNSVEDPDVFFFMRGFPDLESRDPLKARFYESDLWKNELEAIMLRCWRNGRSCWSRILTVRCGGEGNRSGDSARTEVFPGLPASSFSSQDPDGIHRARPPRRQKRRDTSDGEHDRGHGAEDPWVRRADVDDETADKAAGRKCRNEPDGNAGDREPQAFGQDEAHDARWCGAEGQPHPHLAPAR